MDFVAQRDVVFTSFSKYTYQEIAHADRKLTRYPVVARIANCWLSVTFKVIQGR